MWRILKYIWIYRERCLVIALFVVSIVSLFLPRETGLFIYRRINRSVITPFQIVIDQIELYHGAIERAEELEEENIRLSLALRSMRIIEDENIRLRGLLDFSVGKGVEFLTARVIGYNLSGPLSSIVIDKGRKDGIKSLLPVLNQDGLVGKVVEVDDGSSVVELFAASGFGVSGMVVECGEVGIVTTRGAGRLYLEGLNLRTEIKAGDRVVSSGLGRVFPVGIPIGIVQSVALDPLGVHKVASVIPTVRLETVREVFVLSDSEYVKADPLWLIRAEGSLTSLWDEFSGVSPGNVGLENRPDSIGRYQE